MIGSLPPAVYMIVGGLIVPLFRGRTLKSVWMLLMPLLALWTVIDVPLGQHWQVSFLGYDLLLGQVDALSRPFGVIFSIISVLAVLFALKEDNDLQHSSAMIYAGGAMGVAFAGDFISLYVHWELMAVASTFVILARRSTEAYGAAFRYVLVHLFGGLLLLAGILIRFQTHQTLAVEYLGLKDLGTALIFIGVAVNAAIIPLHAWLKDAYPAATATGAVFLSAFTTKSAVYVMARLFPGTEALIWLGALMTVFPIFYAVLENDIRGVLSYSLINQVGFMMVGVGIGSQLSINGTVAHAFCHILYKALLFMSAGAVLTRTGRIKATDLGGLYHTMPFTCLCCCIGAASISAFPLFSGFVSKSMIVSAAGHHHLVLIWFALQFASAGVFHHAGIKVPYFMFFGHDSGLRPREAPWNMRLAMGIAAAFCIGIAVWPKPLYDLLPYPVHYIPYTASHVVGQLQLLMFGALAFALLILSGSYPAELRAVNLDFDWFWRKGGRAFARLADVTFNSINRAADQWIAVGLTGRINAAFKAAPAGLAQGLMALVWAARNITGPELENKKDRLQAAFSQGTAPVGLAAGGTLLILILVLILL